MQGKIELKELIQNALKVGRKPKEVVKFAKKVIEQIKTIPEKKKRNLIKIRGVDERKIIGDAKEFLRGRLQADITVYVERDRGIYDPKRKAAMAMPLRPAIYIE
jgi:DNA repair protein RadC